MRAAVEAGRGGMQREGGSAIDILSAASLISRSQGAVVSVLEAMLQRKTMPPSLLFVGPEGAGKGLIAVGLAARLNCGSQCRDAEKRCPSCTKIGKLEHPDLLMIFPVPYGEMEKSMPVIMESRREDFFNSGEFGTKARSIGIDCVRRIIETLSKQPYEGRRSVVIISEAHMMTTEAQNALLRVLEEPPPSAVLILVTEFPDRLLPTVSSRCQHLRFDALAADTIALFLQTWRAVEAREAERIAALAQGNLRRGLQLLDERFLAIRGDAVSLTKLVLDGKADELIAEAEAVAGRYGREEVAELLDEVALVLRSAMRAVPGGEDGGEESREDGGELEVVLSEIGKQRVAAASGRDVPADLGRIRRACRSLGRNADVELTLVQLLLDLTGKWY